MAGNRPETASSGSTPAPMHVLHVADYDVVVRFGRMLRHMALALCAEGLRVTVLTDDPATVADLEGTPVECHRVRHLSGWLAWRLPRELTRRLHPRPRVVHLLGTACLRTVGGWALRSGIPVVVHVLSVRDVDRLLSRRRWGSLHVAVGCAGLLQLCRQRCAALAERCELMLPAFLMPDPAQGSAGRAAEHTVAVLWAGRFDAGAGLETLVDAVAQLRRRDCDLQAALIGTGPGLRSLWRRIREAQVQDCITVIDEPRSWDKAMWGADVCVVPAHQPELSLAPLLAMALGKIVLSTPGQIAEWFIADKTAWEFTPGSAAELAHHLSRVAEDDPAARQLRRSAAAYVRAHHAVSHLVENLVAAYHAVAQTRSPGTTSAVRIVGGDQP